MLRRTGGLALVWAVLMALAAGDARAAYEGEYLGVNVQAMVKRGFTPDTWPGFLGTAREGGFTGARHDAGWGAVEPHAPEGGRRSYRWEALDRFVAATASAGMRWTPVLSVVPSWARDADGRFTARHYPDFIAFGAAVAKRYGAGGDFWRTHPQLPELPPTVYEVWNEPNSANAWNGIAEPAAYAELFRQMRQAVKGVDPSPAVVVSLGWQGIEEFIAGLAGSGDPAWAGDGIAFHPYAPTVVGITVLMRKLTQALAAHGRSGTPLYVNEIGWPRAFAAPATHAWDGFVSDETRAASLSIIGDALQRSDCGVRMYAPYSLVEPEQDGGNVEDWMGILHRDGSPTAAFTALRAAARRASAAPGGRLAICGEPGTSATEALLPLSLTASRTSGACFAGVVRYAGNPLEQAGLTAYRGNKLVTQETDSFGRTTVCAPAGSEPILLRAGIRDIGVSPVLRCGGERPECSVVEGVTVGDGAGGPGKGTAPGERDRPVKVEETSSARRCGLRFVSLHAIRVRARAARLPIAVRDPCSLAEPRRKVQARLYVTRSGGRSRLIRRVQLSRRSRTIRVTVRRSDRSVLLVTGSARSKDPKVRHRILLRRPSR